MNQIDNLLFKAIEDHLERRTTRIYKRRLSRQQRVRLMVFKRTEIENLMRDFRKGLDKILEEFINENTNF